MVMVLVNSEKVKASQFSALDELEKIANLRDGGVVSEDEFQKKKKQLLELRISYWIGRRLIAEGLIARLRQIIPARKAKLAGLTFWD